MGPWRTDRELRKRGQRGRRFAWGLAGICVVAFGLRLLAGHLLHDSYAPVLRPGSGTDNATYQHLARSVVDGSYDYGKGFYYQPLYYAVFLPLILFFSGGSLWAVVVVQALLGALTAGLVGVVFARLGGRACGLLAAVFVTLSRTHVFYTPFTLIEILQSFWLALLAALAVAAVHRRQWWYWGLAGLVAGLANATRGNIVLLLPVILIAAWYSLRLRRRDAWLAVAALLVLFYLPQLPFAWANYRATGHWTGPSTAAGAVLALGNTPEAPPGGRDPDAGAGPMEYPPSYFDYMARDAATGPGHRSVAASSWRWIGREPLAFAELKWRMLLLFWHRGEIPNNVALPQPGQPGASPLLNGPWLLDFLVLGGLGLAGALLAFGRWRRRPAWWLAGGLVWCYAGSLLVFYILGRFRLPIVPLIGGFAAWMVVQLYRRYRTYRRHPARQRPIARALGLLILAMLVTSFGSDAWRLVAEAPALRLARPHGVNVLLLGQERRLDHGPQSFGGWYPLRAVNFSRVEKTFAAAPRRDPADLFTNPAAPADLADSAAFASATLHLAVLADTSVQPLPNARVTLLLDGQPVAHHDLQFTRGQGLTWVNIPLPPGVLPAAALAIAPTPPPVTLGIRLDASDPTRVSLIFDSQRDYRRTRVFAAPPANPLDQLTDTGECVVDLVLHLAPAPPAADTAPAIPADAPPLAP